MQVLVWRVVLVTGRAVGIGRASALAFAEAGARVMIGDVDIAGGRATADQIAAAGGSAHFLPADVGCSADRTKLIEGTIAAFGHIDVLHANAGIELCKPIWDRAMSIEIGFSR
jgi:NAD(P)-dependent dehydrogenase (short-subunit alcohol dehydrogenase family)